MKIRKCEGGQVMEIRFLHKGKDIVFQNVVGNRAEYTEDIQEVVRHRIEIEFGDIYEMDMMIDMLIRAEEHLLGEMGKWKVKSIDEEENKRRMERMRAINTCGNCGCKINLGNNFCQNCGYKVIWDEIRCMTDRKGLNRP